jgi:hypothetical protein
MPPVSTSSKNQLPARGIDDGDPPARQRVEERRFADVGTANDCNYRYGHVLALRFAGKETLTL